MPEGEDLGSKSGLGGELGRSEGRRGNGRGRREVKLKNVAADHAGLLFRHPGSPPGLR